MGVAVLHVAWMKIEPFVLTVFDWPAIVLKRLPCPHRLVA